MVQKICLYSSGPQNYIYCSLFKSWSFQNKALQINSHSFDCMMEKIVPCKDKFVVENKNFGMTFEINKKLLFPFIFPGNVSLLPDRLSDEAF